MKNEIMTPENKRWSEFTERLGGEEGCDFRERVKGKPETMTWICDRSEDRPLAKAILERMGNIDIERTMEYFSKHGGHCDCEILFNVDR